MRRVSNSKLSGPLRFLCGILGLAAGLNLVGLWAYMLRNRSGHTGLNPYLCLIVFAPCLLCGIGLTAIDQSPGGRRIARLAIALGAFGALFLVYIDQANLLLPYEVWIQRGMP